MIEIYDTCNIALGPEPSGGLTLRIEHIEGREGITLLIPIAKGPADELMKGIAQLMGKPNLVRADMNDLRKETHNGPQGNAAPHSHLANEKLPRM